MKDKICIIGCGGHCRSVITLLELNGYKISGIFDDSYREKSIELISGYRISGKVNMVASVKNSKIVLAVGSNEIRNKLFFRFQRKLLKENLFHPQAKVEKRVILGIGNQLFANAYINSDSVIGDNNILNTGCIIEHELTIGSSNHISVGAILCGRVKIGDRCFIGAGAVVIDKIKICSEVTVGANSVVIEDIKEPGIYAGNPARKIR